MLNWEIGIDMYTLRCVKWMTNKNLLYKKINKIKFKKKKENYKILMNEIKDDINRWRDTMFLDWKNQYCENDYTTQSNLQIQCNPYQIINGIFYKTRTKNLKICMETQKTLSSQSSLEGKKQSWRNQTP